MKHTTSEKIILIVGLIIITIFLVGAFKPPRVQKTEVTYLQPGQSLWTIYTEHNIKENWSKWDYEMRKINNIKDLEKDMQEWREIIILKGES